MDVRRSEGQQECRAGGRVTPDGDTVYLYSGNASAAELEGLLAHEFVHVYQLDHGLPSFDGDRFVRKARLEGPALYIQDVYAQRYLDASVRPYERMRRDYRTERGSEKFTAALYYFGARYVRQSVSETQAVSELYASWPRTSEQLLHGPTDEELAVKNLTVTSERSETLWPADEGRYGELVLRVVLSTEISDAHAERAAAGWGNDRFIAFRELNGTRDDAEGRAWVLRFDDAREATEFRTAAQQYLDERATRRGSVWRTESEAFDVENVTDETVVLFVGSPSFVRGVTARGNSSAVSVVPP